MTTLSVSSSDELLGGKPDGSSASSTCSTKSGCCSCRADTLTAISIGRPEPRPQLRRVQARLDEHPAAERHDQARVSSASGMNSQRRQQAELRMLPAEERLVACDLAGRRGRHDRLVVEPKLVALDRVAELADPAEAHDRGLVELGVEECEAEVGLRLRAVHRRVRLLQQLGSGSSPREMPMSTSRPTSRRPRSRSARRAARRMPLRDDRRRRRVDDALDDHRELVAAEPRGGVRRANHRL